MICDLLRKMINPMSAKEMSDGVGEEVAGIKIKGNDSKMEQFRFRVND